MLYTQEQVEELNYNQCKAALKVIAKMYNLEKSFSDKEHFNKVWPQMDEIVNTILWLEDRIKQFEDPRIPSMDPQGPVVKEPEPKPEPKKTGRPARKFKVLDTVYENIHEAAKATGIKLQTLKTYVSRKPDRYSYID
jgi:hypothetical protein